MTSPYLPMTETQRGEMLATLGYSSIEDLIHAVLGAECCRHSFRLPPGRSEAEVREALAGLAARNRPIDSVLSLLGGGAYGHYIPAAVRQLASRSEFYTAYTPYQPEISQGTLQAIFEFQTMICEITGTEVSNASLYDGATAAVEGISMARALSKRKGMQVLWAASVNPRYRAVAETYAGPRGFQLSPIEFDSSGSLPDWTLLGPQAENAFALVVQQPNYFGCWENLPELIRGAKEREIAVVVVTDLLACALAEPPGALGADIVVGEAQPFGNALGFGGPHLGFIACQKTSVRQMPGRIVGETVDLEGKRAFVLTAQTREQHIRREKATSNICSNQALNALCTVIHLSLLGKEGFIQMAGLAAANAHTISAQLVERGGRMAFEGQFFREFAIYLDPAWVSSIEESGRIFLGIPLERYYPKMKGCRLIAATEMTTWEKVQKAIGESGN